MGDEQLLALGGANVAEAFTEYETTLLRYADAMTHTDEDVSDELFARVASLLNPEELMEVTFTIAFENMLSKFHRTLRINAEGFCPVRVLDR